MDVFDIYLFPAVRPRQPETVRLAVVVRRGRQPRWKLFFSVELREGLQWKARKEALRLRT